MGVLGGRFRREAGGRRWACSSRPLLLLAVLALIAIACSDDEESGPALSSEQTTATTPAADEPEEDLPPELDEAEVAQLWEQTLTVFEAPPDDREQVAAALPASLPGDRALELAEINFLTEDPVDLTSNARFALLGDGSLSIVDCTDAAGPTALGATTAGFTAVASLADDGAVQIDELKSVANCVQREPAQAAIDTYELFRQSGEDFWQNPSLDSPLIAQYSTEKAEQAFRDYLQTLADADQLDDTVVNYDALQREVEVVGYLPDEIRLRVCEHGDETVGIFNKAGERADLSQPPWRAETTVRMRKVGGEWLFDEVISRVEGDCLMASSQFGLQSV